MSLAQPGLGSAHCSALPRVSAGRSKPTNMNQRDVISVITSKAFVAPRFWTSSVSQHWDSRLSFAILPTSCSFWFILEESQSFFSNLNCSKVAHDLLKSIGLSATGASRKQICFSVFRYHLLLTLLLSQLSFDLSFTTEKMFFHFLKTM